MDKEKPIISGIKSWAEEDRPREKLLLKGKQALSDAELLAIMIGSGSRDETAVELCRKILRDAADNDLHRLAKLSVADLMAFKGIGEAKAISIVAALELGHRRRLAEVRENAQISSSRDAFNELQPITGDLPHEEFWVLFLSRSNRIIARERISSGGVAGTVVDIKILFKKGIQLLASGIILCHNHPSGNLQPSQADKDLTKKAVEAGKLFEMTVLDHIIVSESPANYFSFADEGLL